MKHLLHFTFYIFLLTSCSSIRTTSHDIRQDERTETHSICDTLHVVVRDTLRVTLTQSTMSRDTTHLHEVILTTFDPQTGNPVAQRAERDQTHIATRAEQDSLILNLSTLTELLRTRREEDSLLIAQLRDSLYSINKRSDAALTPTQHLAKGLSSLSTIILLTLITALVFAAWHWFDKK